MPTSNHIRNFGRNLAFEPTDFYRPADEAEVLRILDEHRGESIRAIGRLHSWSKAPTAEDVLLDLSGFDTVEIREEAGETTAIVGAGCQIKRLLKELDRQGGLTLPSLGLIDEQAIAGAVSTGTHGSGKNSLSHYVVGVRVARYDAITGEPVIVEIDAGEELRAARCSLGCLGVILSVRIQCRPKFHIEEHFRCYKSLPEILDAEQQFPLQQFFLVPWRWNYFAQHRRETDARRSRLAWLYRCYWSTTMDYGMHIMLLFFTRILRSKWIGRFLFRWVISLFVIRGWRVVDRSNVMLVMEHELFRHIETELFVPRDRLGDALQFTREVMEIGFGERAALSDETRQRLNAPDVEESLQALRGRYFHHYPICIRKVLPDDTLISMASGDAGDQAWYAISLISYAHRDRRESFYEFASALSRGLKAMSGARPHWAKHCPLTVEELTSLYPQFETFRGICERADPEGLFRNAWTSELLQRELSPQAARRDPVS